MEKFKCIAGSYQGTGYYHNRTFKLKPTGSWLYIEIALDQMKGIGDISKSRKASLSKNIGYGIAGDFVMGPLGVLGGVLLAGRTGKDTVEIDIEGGESFWAEMSRNTRIRIEQDAFNEKMGISEPSWLGTNWKRVLAAIIAMWFMFAFLNS